MSAIHVSVTLDLFVVLELAHPAPSLLRHHETPKAHRNEHRDVSCIAVSQGP
jgi:hypothetical protein